MTRFGDLDGRRLEIESLFLEHGLCVSGSFIFRAGPNQICAHLAKIERGGAVSWIALTFDEARAVAVQFAADGLEEIAS